MERWQSGRILSPIHAEIAQEAEHDSSLKYGRDKKRHLDYWDSVIGNLKLAEPSPHFVLTAKVSQVGQR
ncbi:hypothetical protein ACFL1S_01075 [Pseudomonadota bacterium]